MSRFVVTGAAGILGRATSRRLESCGHVVAGVDFTAEAADFPGLFAGGCDLRRPEDAERAASILQSAGPIDGLVNIAGGFRWETISEGSAESWEWLYSLNVLTALNMTRALLPGLRSTEGAVVNVGAAAAAKAGKGMGPYSAAKSGVAKLTEALAEELKGTVRVNAVLPSILDTPANRAEMGDADAARWVHPDELAAVIAFLLSPDASAVTGALIPVTGRI